MFSFRATLTRTLLAVAACESVMLTALYALRAATGFAAACRTVMLLSALSAQGRAAGTTALGTLTTTLGRTVSAQRFQRLRQFACIEFAVFVRVEFIQQVLRHLFRAGALMLLPALCAGTAGAGTAAVRVAALPAGLLGVGRQRGHHDHCNCHRLLHGLAPVVRLLCHRVHVRKMRRSR